MSLLTSFIPVATDSEGRTVPNALLYSYAVGTNTPKDTYSNQGLTIPNANPLESDGSGKFFDVFLGAGGYKLVVTDQFGVVLWEQDNYYPALDTGDLANIDADIAAVSQQISQTFLPCTDTGVADAYVLAPSGTAVAPTAYGIGMVIIFSVTHANTGASTVNVSGLGIKNLVDQSGAALTANFLVTGTFYQFIYIFGAFYFLQRGGLVATVGIADGSITAAKLATNAVTTIKILDKNVTTGKMADGTPYKLIGYDGSNVVTEYTSPLRVLSQGSFTAAASVSFILSTLDPTQTENNTYIIRFIGFQPATDDVNMYVTMSTDAGGTYANSNYAWVSNGRTAQAAPASRVYGDDTDSEIEVNGATGASDAMSNAAGETADLIMWISDMNTGGSFRPNLKYKLTYWDANATSLWTTCDGAATNFTAGDYDAIKFQWEGGGNFSAVGKYILYKVANAL